MRYLIFFLLLFLFCGLSQVYSEDKEPFLYQHKGARDPFIPLVDREGRYLLESEKVYSFADLSLSGILWDPQGKSSALINDQIAAAGDTVYGFLIKSITKDEVTLSKDGQEYILRSTLKEGGY